MKKILFITLFLISTSLISQAAPRASADSTSPKVDSARLKIIGKKDTVKYSGNQNVININNSNCCDSKYKCDPNPISPKKYFLDFIVDILGPLVTLITALAVILSSGRHVKMTIKDGQISLERQLANMGRQEEARMNEKWVNYLRDAASALIEKASRWMTFRAQYLDYDQFSKNQRVYEHEIDISNDFKRHSSLLQIDLMVRQSMTEFVSAKSKIELLFKLRSASGSKILNLVEKIFRLLEDEKEIKENINSNQSYDKTLKSIIFKQEKLDELLGDFNDEIKIVLENEWNRILEKMKNAV